jgi:hypothetical protein
MDIWFTGLVVLKLVNGVYPIDPSRWRELGDDGIMMGNEMQIPTKANYQLVILI